MVYVLEIPFNFEWHKGLNLVFAALDNYKMATQEKGELDLDEYCDLDKLDVRREVRKNYRHLAQNIEGKYLFISS